MAKEIDINLYKLIAEALHYQWDPIGISDIPHSVGEYDSYVPELYELICINADEKLIFDYLWKIEVQHMGLDGNRKATLAFVDYLKIMNFKLDWFFNLNDVSHVITPFIFIYLTLFIHFRNIYVIATNH